MDNNIYVGAFSIAMGICDLKIDFKTVEPQIDPSGNIVTTDEEVAQRVTFSLPLAKEFCNKLQNGIKDYENRFGPIQSVSELTKLIENR